MNQGFSQIANNLTRQSAVKCMQYNANGVFHKRSHSARAINILYSTIFFDDDDDINWDEDDDDDGDLNFNVQYQGRAFDEDFKGSSDGSSSSRSVKSSARGEMKQGAFDDIEDDTDDSYYDNLFKLQAGITIDEKDNDDNYGDELEEEEDIIPGGMPNNLKEYQTSQHEQLEDSIKQAEEYHESMSQIKNEFFERRMKQVQNHQWERKLDRYEKKAYLMEERAMFLALRALRQQSKMFTTINLYQSMTSIPMTDDHINTESNWSTPTKALPKSKDINISIDSFLDDKTIPSPTLSYSSTRNYKRQDDYPREKRKRKNNDDVDDDNDDANIIDIEKRLYGNRYKNAFGVYLRLLQVLDEIRVEAKHQASEYLLDQMEQSFEVSQAHNSDNFPSAVSSSNTMSYTNIQNTIKMKKQNQERIKVIIALSLFRRHDDGYNNSVQHTNTASSSALLMQNQQQQQQKVMKLIQEKHDLENISIQDLIYILQIRGNVKRRGRIPRSRQKLVELLTLSFWSDIFKS